MKSKHADWNINISFIIHVDFDHVWAEHYPVTLIVIFLLNSFSVQGLVSMIMMRFSVLSSPAPPLTLDNILEVVKNVRNWRTLGQHILHPIISSRLDAIQRQHVSDEACLRAVIEDFLSGNSLYKPSWRAVIWFLYKANEIQLVEHIRSFAEPVKGMERDIMDGSMLRNACFTGCTHCAMISVMCSCSSRAHSDCGKCYRSDGECGSGEKEGGVV